MTCVCITGAAGNLGRLLTRHILDNESDLDVILMQHREQVPPDIHQHPNVSVRNGDLSKPHAIHECLHDAEIIVHLAGVLFKANPEKFLFETNFQYFKNLVGAAKEKKIKKVILISFPHVEGPTTRSHPATGRLYGTPISVHAATRLEAERHLFNEIEIPVAFRVGMVYGKGVLMIDAAQWLAKRWLLGVWKEPTEIQLISKSDFCGAVVAAIKTKQARGIYHVGDEGDDTLQSFLDLACDTWGYRRPWRMPLGLIYFAAQVSELASSVFNTKSPLTRDFIDIGRVPYYGDTTRFRAELLPELSYPDVRTGIGEFSM